MKHSRGFTLFEAVIYIALLGVLMTGAVVASYQLLQGSTTLAYKSTVQDEGNFALRKIEWALMGASDATVSGTTLTITKYTGTVVTFRKNGTTLEMRETLFGAYVPVTTGNVDVKTVVFVVAGTKPKSVTATIGMKSIGGTEAALPFSITKYLRI